MKELPVEVEEGLDAPTIEPTLLIELELDEPLYLSTWGEYTYGEKTYVPGYVIDQPEISQDQCAFSIINEDYRHTTAALTGAYLRLPVSIYWSDGAPVPFPIVEPGYFEEDYYEWDGRPAPILLFRGNLTQFTQITSVLGVVATRSAARRYPTLRVLPPIANFVRPEGAIVHFGDYTFRLEPRD